MISLDDLLAKNLLPDAAIRIGIRNLLGKKLREETRENAIAQSEALSAFIEELKRSPIAIKTADANEQHYEVPTQTRPRPPHEIQLRLLAERNHQLRGIRGSHARPQL
jgi:hypothetical protein